jgi:hypothetical protein
MDTQGIPGLRPVQLVGRQIHCVGAELFLEHWGPKERR